MSKFIITGSPKSGKPEVISLLKQAGYSVYEAVSTVLIQEQLALPQPVLPQTNPRHFAQLALGRMWKQMSRAQARAHVCFFDTAIPDIMALLTYHNIPINQSFYDTLTQCNYHPEAFIFPPWEKIYLLDEQEPWSFEECQKFYQYLISTYESLGFTLHEIPRTLAESRTQFILNKLPTAL